MNPSMPKDPQLIHGLNQAQLQQQQAVMRRQAVEQAHINLACDIYARIVADHGAMLSNDQIANQEVWSDDHRKHLARYATDSASILLSRYGVDIKVEPKDQSGG